MDEQQMFIAAISAMGLGYIGMWTYFVHINRIHSKDIVSIHSEHAKKIKDLTDNYIEKLESYSKDLRELLVSNAVEQEKQMTLISNVNRAMEKILERDESSRSRR